MNRSVFSRKEAVQILGAGAVATSLATTGCQGNAGGRIAVARLADIRPWLPVLFSYPGDSPALLLDVNEPAGGVGPKQSIVAFSAVCTHMGCTVQLNSSLEIRGKSRSLFCPCHTSAFDPVDLGAAIAGPATYGLPAIELELDGGTVYATGLRPGRPVFKRSANGQIG